MGESKTIYVRKGKRGTTLIFCMRVDLVHHLLSEGKASERALPSHLGRGGRKGCISLCGREGPFGSYLRQRGEKRNERIFVVIRKRRGKGKGGSLSMSIAAIQGPILVMGKGNWPTFFWEEKGRELLPTSFVKKAILVRLARKNHLPVNDREEGKKKRGGKKCRP